MAYVNLERTMNVDEQATVNGAITSPSRLCLTAPILFALALWTKFTKASILLLFLYQ